MPGIGGNGKSDALSAGGTPWAISTETNTGAVTAALLPTEQEMQRAMP
jgi:hypothetical protein